MITDKWRVLRSRLMNLCVTVPTRAREGWGGWSTCKIPPFEFHDQVKNLKNRTSGIPFLFEGLEIGISVVYLFFFFALWTPKVCLHIIARRRFKIFFRRCYCYQCFAFTRFYFSSCFNFKFEENFNDSAIEPCGISYPGRRDVSDCLVPGLKCPLYVVCVDCYVIQSILTLARDLVSVVVPRR